MIYLDGTWQEHPDYQRLLVCLTTGQAVFETVLFEDHVLWFWERHRERLQKTLEFFNANPGRMDLEKLVREGIKKIGPGQSARIKIIILLPIGSRAITLTEKDVIVLVESPALPEPTSDDISLLSVRSPFCHAPLIAYKTINYGHFYYAQHQARSAGFSDVLFLDEEGYLLESSIANVFVSQHGKIFTPPADGRILPGTVRGAIIEHMGAIERPIHIDELNCTDFMFLSGSVRQLRRVVKVDQQILSNQENEFREVLKRWDEIKQAYKKGGLR